MSRLKGADLGIVTPTLTSLGYTAPTAASVGAAKSTVGPGLPGFAGRSVGDLHFNSTTGKEHVFTGTPGVNVTDDFNRVPDAGNLTQGASGSYAPIPNSSLSWVQPTGFTYGPSIYGGRVSGTNSSQQTAAALINLATTGTAYQEVAADIVLSSDTNNQTASLSLRSSLDMSSRIEVICGPTNVTVYRRGTQVQLALATYASVGLSNLAAGTSARFDAVIDTAGNIAVSRDGTVVVTANDNTLTGSYVGFSGILGSATGAATPGTLDNFQVITAGTASWSPAITSTALGLGSALMNYRGAWSGSNTYAVNDVVSRAYGLYVALTGSSNSDPVSVAGLTTTVNVTNGTGSTSGNGGTFTQGFTTSAPILLDTLTANTAGIAGISSQFTLSISDTVGGAAKVIGGVTLSSAVSPTATGRFDAPLASQVTLPAGTYYFNSAETGTGGGGGNHVIGRGVTPAASGATLLAQSYVNGGAYQTTAALDFALKYRAVAWQKIAQSGNQENVGQVGASGAAVTIADPEVQSITRIILSANCTLTFPAPTAGKSFTVTLIQDATGSRTVTWPATVLWPGGTAPTLTTTPGKGDVFSFMADTNNNWIGFVAGQNY